MRLRRTLGSAVEAGLLLCLVALVVGQPLGQPLVFGFVTTGSMAPTLQEGDGFVAVPAQLSGQIRPGDVVVFEAREVNGGGLTTHRVVGVTEEGFVTKGDANSFTDQANDEPPVQRAQVVATVLRPGGHVLVVPHLGTAVERARSAIATVQGFLAATLGVRALLGVRGLAYLFALLALVAYGVAELRAEGKRRRVRDRATGTSGRRLVAALAVLLVAGATAAMVLPAGPQSYDVVSASFDSDRTDVVRTGETVERPHRVANGGVVPVVVHLAPGSDDVAVTPRRLHLAGGASAEATVTVRAPARPGHYRRYVVEYRYLAVVPRGAIATLYRVHPWLPILAIDGVVGLGFYLVGIRLVGPGRLRPRSRPVGPAIRVRRWFRRRY